MGRTHAGARSLHDCSKVTTPGMSWIKLQNLKPFTTESMKCDAFRIVIAQQAETDYWKAIANGALQEEEQLKVREQSLSELDEELPS
ncbi:hypothetical protein O9993_02905 [Vibrio lentus]|nr:hypothetical protein [Vibrio lentus]